MQDQRGRVGTVGAWQVGLNSNDESKTLKRKPKEKKKKSGRRKKKKMQSTLREFVIFPSVDDSITNDQEMDLSFSNHSIDQSASTEME